MRLTTARWMLVALAVAVAERADGAAAARRLEGQRPLVAAMQLLAEARAANEAASYLADAAALREIEAQFIAALKIAPRNRAVRAGLAAFYEQHAYTLETPAAELLECLALDADPSGLALALVGGHDDGLHGEFAQTLLLAALERQPQQPVLWFELAGRTYDPAARAAYLAEATDRARALGPPGAAAMRILATAEIADLLASGLFEDALAAMERLPESLRRALEEGPVPSASLDVLGLRLIARARDLRPELAVAEAVAGDPRRAALRIAGLPWHLRLKSPTAPSSATLRAALVHCAIGDVPGDPFRFVAAALLARPTGGEEALVDSAAGWRLIAAIAHRRGARHLEAHALDLQGAFGQACDDCDAEPSAALAPPPTVTARAATLRAELDRRTQQSAADRAALLLEIDARDRLARGRNRRAHSGTVFSERRLPSLVASVEDDSAEEAAEPAAVSAATPGAPALSSNREPKAVLVDRTDLDPAGAFWLELERGAGATEAVFTGLPALRYEVVPHPEQPLLDGETVQIEARDFEGDTPDEVDRGNARVLLRAALADLRADSDKDGLTDVVEARWLTDPESADTDRDGFDDAVDPSPLVPSGASALAEPLALALAEIFGTTTEVLLADRTPSCCRTLVQQTEIVVAPRALLAGVGSAARLLVFSPLEHEARPELAWRSGAAVLSLVYFDDAVEHGIIQWVRGGSGGTLRLERRADGWHVVHVGDWVS